MIPPTKVILAIGWAKESVTKFAGAPFVVAALLLTVPSTLPVALKAVAVPAANPNPWT